MPKGSQEGGATHTAVRRLQAGKKLFISVVVELLIYHFSKFLFLDFFWTCEELQLAVRPASLSAAARLLQMSLQRESSLMNR